MTTRTTTDEVIICKGRPISEEARAALDWLGQEPSATEKLVLTYDTAAEAAKRYGTVVQAIKREVIPGCAAARARNEIYIWRV
jgi:GrpB-like predicted nucleotidyltransferase (UPF0157 family)